MGNKVKDVDMKSRTYYLFNDIIVIKIFDPNIIEIDKSLQKKLFFLHWIYNDQRYEICKN